MGTRSLTYVYDTDRAEENIVLCMYRQMDGYPSGHGAELAQFLMPLTLVNGITDYSLPIANGMGCLAAQLVAYFKKGVGQFYLVPGKVEQDCDQDYEYHIYGSVKTGIRIDVSKQGNEVLYTGSIAGLLAFTASLKTET